jgi:hypothetical protein
VRTVGASLQPRGGNRATAVRLQIEGNPVTGGADVASDRVARALCGHLPCLREVDSMRVSGEPSSGESDASSGSEGSTCSEDGANSDANTAAPAHIDSAEGVATVGQAQLAQQSAAGNAQSESSMTASDPEAPAATGIAAAQPQGSHQSGSGNEFIVQSHIANLQVSTGSQPAERDTDVSDTTEDQAPGVQAALAALQGIQVISSAGGTFVSISVKRMCFGYPVTVSQPVNQLERPQTCIGPRAYAHLNWALHRLLGDADRRAGLTHGLHS